MKPPLRANILQEYFYQKITKIIPFLTKLRLIKDWDVFLKHGLLHTGIMVDVFILPFSIETFGNN